MNRTLVALALVLTALVGCGHKEEAPPPDYSGSGCAYARAAVESGDTSGIDMAWYDANCR